MKKNNLNNFEMDGQCAQMKKEKKSISIDDVRITSRKLAILSLNFCVSYHSRKDINDLAARIEDYFVDGTSYNRRIR